MLQIFGIIFFTIFSVTNAQKADLERIEPPNWWVGMQNKNLQLLVHGDNIAQTTIKIESELVKITEIHKTENPNYLFIDIEILTDKSGSFDILFLSKNKKVAEYNYILNEKSEHKRGISSEDVIYLLMPDRFANGDPNNDNSDNMLEKADRNNLGGRHGGDIQGIIDNLDYLYKLGITGLWLNPVIENNNPEYSYHGYGTTDFYKIDERFGTNELYKTLSDKCHEKGLKLIIDVIYNHTGINHWWIKDLPSSDWLNNDENFRTTFRGNVISDPYSSVHDKEQFYSGWFVGTMPDLNQKNTFLATYLIQNTIWWVEFADIDAIRIDTYPYPDQDFGSDLVASVRKEYPDIFVFGETWLHETPQVAYYQENNNISGNYNSHLNSVTDFPLYYAIKAAFNEKEGWDTGLFRLADRLAEDFLYSNPYILITFLDNHDIDRFFTAVGKNINKFKMGFAFMITTRGIPVIYYGTEIAMEGQEHNHGLLRQDFPGGWQDDKTNAFKQTNLSKTQSEAYNFVSKLLNWRKTNNAVKNGKLLHFLPDNNVYVYFRYTDNEAVMVLLNNDDTQKKEIDCNKFKEILSDYKTGYDVINDKKIVSLETITIEPKSVLIIELLK